jgi:cytoskeletal protein CcmA (bactofilin family)
MILTKKKTAFANQHSLLCAATKVDGDIHFSGDFYLEGILIGNIYAEPGKPSKLVITETGAVEGEIHAANIIVNGKVHGTIYSSSHIELAAKAVVVGAIHYQLIDMVKGSQLVGQIQYGCLPADATPHFLPDPGPAKKIEDDGLTNS